MDDWYQIINENSKLTASALKELDKVGFIVISGPVKQDCLPQLVAAYDSAILNAPPDDVSVGSSTPESTTSLIAGRNSTACTRMDQYSKLVVKQYVNHSNSVPCTPEP
jgi:hypothetical protein